jgi:hypothetical protein
VLDDDVDRATLRELSREELIELCEQLQRRPEEKPRGRRVAQIFRSFVSALAASAVGVPQRYIRSEYEPDGDWSGAPAGTTSMNDGGDDGFGAEEAFFDDEGFPDAGDELGIDDLVEGLGEVIEEGMDEEP